MPVKNPSLRWLIAASFLSIAVYACAWNAPFVFDDHRGIVENTSLRTLWPTAGMFGSAPDTTPSGRPLVELSLALNYALSGLNPWSYHLLNLCIHLACGWVLYELFARLPGAGDRETGRGAAAAAAALWLLHPLQTAAVTYTVQRAEALMALCYAGTLLCALRAIRAPGRSGGWTTAAATLCAAGMLAKTTMVTAPVAVAVMDWVATGAGWREIARRRWRLYAALAGSWALAAALLAAFPRTASVGFGMGVSPWDYLLLQTQAVAGYLRLWAWPVGQSIDYWGRVPGLREAWPAAAALTALLAVAVAAVARRQWWGFALTMFFLVLAPTSSVVPILTEPIAEHRMYLPSAFLLWMAALGTEQALRRRGLARLGPPLAAACALALAGLTLQRNWTYRSEEALWSEATRRDPGNPRAWVNLGLLADRRRQPAEAERDFRKAAELGPHLPEAWRSLGSLLGRTGRLEQARTCLHKALELHPGFAAAWGDLGNVQTLAGERQAAIKSYGRALALEPQDAAANFNLALLLYQTGELAAAQEPARRAAAGGDAQARALAAEIEARLDAR